MPDISEYEPQAHTLIKHTFEHARFLNYSFEGKKKAIRICLTPDYDIELQLGVMETDNLRKGSIMAHEKYFTILGKLRTAHYYPKSNNATECLQGCLEKEISNLGIASINDPELEPKKYYFINGLRIVETAAE